MLDFAAIGGVFLLAMLAPISVADPTARPLEADALTVIGGAIGVGGLIALLTSLVLELTLVVLWFVKLGSPRSESRNGHDPPALADFDVRSS